MLLQFYPPHCHAATAVRNAGPAPPTALHLPYAQQHLLRWGDAGENYVYQQFYNAGGLQTGLVAIFMQQYSLLQVRCPAAFSALQYSLQGRAIAQLNGNLVLSLVADTYTLQYVPAGVQQLLAPPGLHRFFYLCAEKSMELLQAQHSSVQQVMTHVQTQCPQACFAGRLPVTNALLQKLEQIFSLPATNGHTAIQLAQLVNELLDYYHFQNLAVNNQDSNPVAKATCLIADHVWQPELEILKTIRKELGMEQHALNYQFQKQSGIAVSQYIDRLRMELALLLLLQPAHDVALVAEMLHYNNKSSFEKRFKLELGFASSESRDKVSC